MVRDWFLPVSLLITLATVGCTGGAEQPPSVPTLWVHCFDLTRSPDEHDLQRWADLYRQQVASMQEGDAIVVFGLHENTATAAPLFEAQSRRAPSGACATEQLQARRQFQEMITGAQAAIPRALQLPRAPRSHLVDVLNRIRPDPLRPHIKLLFYSDMLEESPLIDLARSDIRGREIQAAREVARRAGISGLELRARVFCFLDDIAGGQRPRSVNSRRSLELFWHELFAQAGARLVWFESRTLPAQIGGGS